MFTLGSSKSDDSDLVIHGANEEDSSDIFMDWAQDRSISFAKGKLDNLDESWLEIGESNLRLAAKKEGLKDKTGRKYALISYCVPVRLSLKTL